MTYKTKSRSAAQLSTFFALLLGVALAACGAPRSKPADSAAADSLRVALLTPGPVSDQAWNGGAYAGLLRIKDSLGARISHIQTKTPAEFDENFRLYGEQGYSIVFGHGFEYQNAAKRVAPDFPKTFYVTTSGNTTGPNIAGLEFAFEDGAYLAGIVAGATTRSGTIGVIGGQEIPPVKRSFYAFEAGAKSVNPAVKVITSYIGNWDDASAGKEQALAQIGRGVDVIFQNADAAGLGIFQAARESRGVRIFGSNSDQNSLAPEVALGSVVIDLPHAFLLVAKEVQAGTFKPRVISLGMKTDVVRLVINPALRATIPASALSAVDSVTKLLVGGNVFRTGPSCRRCHEVNASAPSAELSAIVPWLDELLQSDDTPDYPGAMNGLQLEHAGPVRRVAAAVDASMRAVEQAVECGANLLLVHHGMFWAGPQPIRGVLHRKLKLLMDNDVAVYSSHLPLDRHSQIGNNVLLARALQLTPSSTWFAYKGVPIGVIATASGTTRELAERVRAYSAGHDHHAVITPHDAERRSHVVAICSGGGASTQSIREARSLGADTLIVGEGPHHTAVEAEEAGVVVMYAGHYATETLGVQALAAAVSVRWHLPWSFLPAPTGL